jgi:glycosyltransferase involved in cell wall biosynthesis
LDHERFSPAPPGIAKAVGRQRFDLEKPFFLYVARLEHPAKNHVRLITAFEQFKAETKLPWQLVLAGSDWHGAEVIHDMIKRSPFHNDVRSLGFVSEEDLPMLYRAADVFVFPSLYEGFGLPPLEAMACGCPVLSSTRGALGEMLGNAAAVVDPEDTSALRAQLTRMATDEQWRRELSAAGLQQARNFHWSTTAAQTIEVYSRAVRRAKSYDPKLALAGEAGHG